MICSSKSRYLDIFEGACFHQWWWNFPNVEVMGTDWKGNCQSLSGGKGKSKMISFNFDSICKCIYTYPKLTLGWCICGFIHWYSKQLNFGFEWEQLFSFSLEIEDALNFPFPLGESQNRSEPNIGRHFPICHSFDCWAGQAEAKSTRNCCTQVTEPSGYQKATVPEIRSWSSLWRSSHPSLGALCIICMSD